jgi:pyruvate formate lyase activating enzyme
MKGIITDIQKFSLHDGDGIRTTVFLKGCNMRCIWCHNPETIGVAPQMVYYKEKCIGCGHCNDYCPTGARKMIGDERSAQSVFEELYSDFEYYRNSGGGITISGGEPLMQADFAAELLSLCKNAGIHTAVESNLSLPFTTLEKLVPYLDTVFFDMKIFDEEEHKKYTEVSNRRVMENALHLGDYPISLIMRTPLIPGITDFDDNIRQIGRFGKTLKNLRYYELLNYNVLAESKYEMVSQEYLLPDARPLSAQRVRELAAIAEESGIKVLWGQE